MSAEISIWLAEGNNIIFISELERLVYEKVKSKSYKKEVSAVKIRLVGPTVLEFCCQQ